MKEKLLGPNSEPLNIKGKTLLGNGLIFVTAMWLLSRLVILAAMLLIAPSLPAPPGGITPTIGWQIFSYWDGGWYQIIATTGYEYVNDGKHHPVAFFPLLPLLSRAVMTLGLPFEVAGTLVNNLAFFGALVLVYAWVEELHGKSAARWTTAALAWCPFSLYGTVIYTEGLFLLLSTAALRAFDKRQHKSAALWGALATATRSTGVALIPAFLLVSWRERRPPIAYIASLAVGGGLFLYSLYCGLRFGDPLAFVHVQRAWGVSPGFPWMGWWKMFMEMAIGAPNWVSGRIKDPWHPLLFIVICGCGFALWGQRKKLGSVKAGYGFCVLFFLLWLVAKAPLINLVMVFGSIYLLWYSRNQLKLIALVYSFFAFALVLNIGLTASNERYAYGIVPVAIAFGLLLSSYPRWGYAIMGFFAILLANYAIAFSQHLWVA